MSNFEYVMWGSLIVIELSSLILNYVMYIYFHKRRLKQIDDLEKTIIDDRARLMNIIANRPYKVEIVRKHEIPNHT